MAPTRTNNKSGEASSSNAGTSSKPRKHWNNASKEPTAAPGVQKLKSSLRQTRRLLAKDNLAADVRVETERRLKALEAELQQAEMSKKERALALRYHKIKFFERQKVVRKLKQTKKRLSSEEASSKGRLESTLLDLRVDLNYIVHYPKTKKYVSLFPPEVRKGEAAEATPSKAEKEKTDAAREEVRSWVRGCMQNGKLPSDPEMHLESRTEKTGKQKAPSWESKDGSKKHFGKKQSDNTVEPADDIEEDAFFGDDDGEEGSDDDAEA